MVRSLNTKASLRTNYRDA